MLKFWHSLPTWGQGLIIIGILAIVAFGVWKLMEHLKKKGHSKEHKK